MIGVKMGSSLALVHTTAKSFEGGLWKNDAVAIMLLLLLLLCFFWGGGAKGEFSGGRVLCLRS